MSKNKKDQESVDQDINSKAVQDRYKDIDDKDFDQDYDLKARPSLKYYAHTFIALGAVSVFVLNLLSKIPAEGLRIYDLLGKPEVSKSTSRWWLNTLSTRISEQYLSYPLYTVLAFCLIMIIYYYLKTITTRYNLNFRFLEVKEGVLSQEINQVDLIKMTDSYVDKKWYLRFLGMSNLVIISTDKTDPTLHLKGISIKEATEFNDYIRTNAYGSSTEYWVAKDRRRRNEKKTPDSRNMVLGDSDGDE